MPFRFSLAVRARDHRGLDGDRQPQAIDDARAGPERSGGWRRRDFLGSRGMGAAGVPALAGWQAQGKKVSPPPLRQGDRGLPSCGPITPSKRPRGSRARQPCKEKTWQTWVKCKGPGFTGEGTETLAYKKAVPSYSGPRASARLPDTGVCRLRIAVPFDRSVARTALFTRGSSSRTSDGLRTDEPNSKIVPPSEPNSG